MSLVAFSFFAPLSIMMAPIIADETSDAQVQYAKLYQMWVVWIKCGTLLVSVYLSKDFLAMLSTILATNAFLSWLTVGWLAVTRKPLPADPGQRADPHQPCTVGFISVWKATGFSLGAWVSGWVLASKLADGADWFPQAHLTTIIAIGCAAMVLVGVICFFVWHSAEEAQIREWRSKQPLPGIADSISTVPIDALVVGAAVAEVVEFAVTS